MTTAISASGRENKARFWVPVGALWFIFCVWIWGSWILGPQFVENDIGRELAPRGYVLWIRFIELISLLGGIWLLWYFVIRPKIRTGRLSFDGLFFLACWTLYMQEPWLNYNNHQFLYTTVSFNRGSWCDYIPGWASPNAELIPVGSIIWCTAYLTLVGLWAVAGSRVMGWYKNRHPDASAMKLIGVCFLAFIPADLLLEHMILMTGLFNYASTVPELTLWAGERYQFPLYETLSWCSTLTCLSAVHFFRNDKGESWGERGMDQLRIPARLKGFARFLAIMGVCQVAMFVTYNVPYFYWSTQGGPFPDYPPYRIAGVCGPDTEFDCPDFDVPIPRRHSLTNRVQTGE